MLRVFRIIRNMLLMRRTQLEHDSHVAPLGLGCVGIPMCYKHAAPLGLKDLIVLFFNPRNPLIRVIRDSDTIHMSLLRG